MKEIIRDRLAALRSEMRRNGFSAFLINGSDPHMGEYVPAKWQSREYISGFSGSYGWLAITLEKAVLWTDSRYYIQAEQELSETGIEMLKAREPETLAIDKWLASELQSGDCVAFDGSCYSASEVKLLQQTLQKKQITIECRVDCLDAIWTDRPALSDAKAFLHPVEWAGKPRIEKFNQITYELELVNAEIIIITALDELGWTFNIRGADVDCNPVVLGYGLVGKGITKLFIDPTKLDEAATDELIADGVEILALHEFIPTLEQLNGQKIFFDPGKTNFLVKQTISQNNQLIEGSSIVALLKSRKNTSELEGMRKAHIADGLALLNFQLWLEDALFNTNITEYDVAEKLIDVRSQQEGYVGTSFFPIVGYQDHGAIVHFTVSAETANQIKPEGILLLDSGGQYSYGTTDITRTIALGEVSDKMKTDFTLVLKGMIALSRIQFPKGTLCCHLDVLARQALWNNLLNYGHGTGHGVGAFMNVHEGPVGIRPDLNDQPLSLGNILSNEPGLYRTGEYGIRIENLIHCIASETNEFGTFYQFETLTRFPIDTQLIEKKLLSPDEIDWLNNYHQLVYNDLAPLTNEVQLQLLMRLTQVF